MRRGASILLGATFRRGLSNMPTVEYTSMAIMKRGLTQEELHERHILMMWLMFLRTPGRKTAPGEPVDLGEVGEVPPKNWMRVTPYSPTERGNDATARRRDGDCDRRTHSAKNAKRI